MVDLELYVEHLVVAGGWSRLLLCLPATIGGYMPKLLNCSLTIGIADC